MTRRITIGIRNKELTPLKQLVEAVDGYLAKRLIVDELGAVTLDIIGDDDFEKLSDEVQDTIYALDNIELNKSSDDDVRKMQAKLRATVDD